ncbi:Hypothetical protein Minf_0867 [Methylacidiphilum infernorum V4]|uniref:Uncharacterized protein n=1 Tax=Methylacidiphilum infernorum (isolate V4) TaxID=481448 RepID=B3E1C6_METI4|nr:Hypothetical protein Minf_0867 [Methylacidiphilum infernorum V4]
MLVKDIFLRYWQPRNESSRILQNWGEVLNPGIEFPIVLAFMEESPRRLPWSNLVELGASPKEFPRGQLFCSYRPAVVSGNGACCPHAAASLHSSS